MILSDLEVSTRLESPLNLINRINKLSGKNTGMELFIHPNVNKTLDEIKNYKYERPAAISDESVRDILESIKDDDSLDEVIPDNAAKIKLGLVKTKALDVLHDSLELLGNNLSNVSKIEKLSSIARDMKNIISDDDEGSKKGPTNIIVYKPITNEINKYETVLVSE